MDFFNLKRSYAFDSNAHLIKSLRKHLRIIKICSCCFADLEYEIIIVMRSAIETFDTLVQRFDNAIKKFYINLTFVYYWSVDGKV